MGKTWDEMTSKEQKAVALDAYTRGDATMAARYNGGYHWPHPVPRRSSPPPMLAGDLLDDPIS